MKKVNWIRALIIGFSVVAAGSVARCGILEGTIPSNPQSANPGVLVGLKQGKDPGQNQPKVRRIPGSRQFQISGTAEKLSRIVLPKMQFKDASVNEALKWLNEELKRRDVGVAAVEIVLTPRAAVSDARITTDIQNVPAISALKYISDVANAEYTIRPDGLVVVDIKKVSR